VRRAALFAALIGACIGAHAALTINSIDVPTRIGRGQTVQSLVSVTRASGSGAETVTIASPAELEIIAPLPAGCALAGAAGAAQTLTCAAVDPGAVGASGSFSFSLRGLALGGGNLSASNAGPPPSSASDSFTVVSGGDLSLAKTVAPGTVFINGQSPTFTLTPALGGDSIPAGATVTVSDQLPGSTSEFTLTTVTAPGYSCNSVAAANAARLLTCTATGPLASLGPIGLQGRLTLAGAGGLRNNASVAPDGVNYIDTASGNDTAFVDFTINHGADPRPTGSFPATALVGSAQSLSIAYVNNGPESTTGGQVRVAIPAGFALGVLPAGCVNSGAGSVNGVAGTLVSCTSGTVTSGGSQTFVLPLTTPAAAQSGNFGVEVVTGAGASLPGGVTDADTTNNQILVPYQIVPPYADLSLTKTKTAGPLAAGAAIVNTIVVRNAGVAAAVYSDAAGATPLRVVDTLRNEEEYVSAGAGWSCTDDGADSAGAGQRRIVCLRSAGGTLAVGATLSLTLNTRVAAALPAPVTLTNQACTGTQALTLLGLSAADGPQPADGNERAGADCASASAIGTPIVSGQAQASVVKESSRDGSSWVDAVGAPPTVLASDNSLYWRITVTTPAVGVNAQQQTIPTLRLADTLPAILNLASPGAGIPGYVTPAAVVTTTLLGGSASGACPASVAAGSSALNCTFSNVAPGTTVQVVVRVDRPFEAGSFTNTASLSSPDVILTAAAAGQLSDAAALTVAGRSDPAVTAKVVNPPNSATAPRVGQVVTYTIVARNLGPNRVDGPFTVSDTLDPTRFLVLSASAIGSGSSPAMSCSFVAATGVVTCATAGGTPVSRYDFYTVTIQARLLKPAVMPASGTVSSFTNSATVSLDQAQNCEFRSTGTVSASCNDAASTSNNSGQVLVDIKVPLVDLVQKKSRVLPGGQSNFGFGDTLRYRFREQNSGPSRAENIVMTDRPGVPAGYTLTLLGVAAVNNVAAEAGFTLDAAKSAATVSCTQAAANADVVCTLAGGAAGFLDAGSEVNFELTFAFVGTPAVVSVGNTARICADESAGYESSGSCVFAPPAAAGNNIAAVNDLVFPKTDLGLTKARISASPVAVNEPVQYLLTVQNLGSNDTTQMRVADVLPANFEWLSAGAYAPTAVPGGFAGLGVSGLACTAAPAAIVAAGQQQTVSCILDGSFPANAAATNTVALTLYARPKAGFYTGPYLSDRTNTASVSPGQDGSGQALSIDINAANNSASAATQVRAASLGGTVFQDRDRSAANGGVPQPAASEPRIAGVSIRLTGTDAFGNAISRTTVTDASGNYAFNDLPPSDASGYTLTQTQPAAYVNGPVAPPAAGANAPTPAGSTYAGGGLAGDSSYSGVVLGAATVGTLFNFPEVRRPSLSGYVYIDANHNALRDAATDPAIAGATLRLFDAADPSSLLASTTTDAAGAYAFVNLDPLKTYIVEEPLPAAPAGLANGPVNAGLVGGAACVGCLAQPDTPLAGTDRLAGIELGAGTDGTQFNFGEHQVTSIGGLVYVDRNRNALVDASPTDGRLAGVIVALHSGADCSGAIVASTTTDAAGNYAFSGLLAGLTYTLCETQPVGYADGGVIPGSNGASAAANAITIANLPASGSAGNQFGERLGSVAGTVYLDANNDGARNAGESGIAGVSVTLSGTDAAGNVVNRGTVSDASGNWRFDDLLAAGAAGYTVTEQAAQPVVGAVATLNGRTTAGTIAAVSAGSATLVASVPSAVSAIALPAGADSLANLFGEVLPVSLSGTVFIDIDNNALQNLPADAGLPGVTLVVSGTDDTGAAVNRTLTTAADGSYGVSDLRPGTYTVTEPTQPAGTSNGQTVAGSVGGVATPPGTLPSAVAGIVLTAPGATSSGNNFAEIAASSVIDGRVWLDLNHDGAMNGAEVGIAGVTIELSGSDSAGHPVARSTTTDASGHYSFGALAPGIYSLREPAQPADTVNGVTLSGRIDGMPSGSATAEAVTPSAISAIALGVNQVSSTNDFGEVPVAAIRGRVYGDNNDNGVIDASETGLAGVSIVLTGTDDLGNAVHLTPLTAADGSYAFTGLRPGSYTVTEPTQPAGTVGGITSAGSAGGTATGASVAPSAIAAIVLGPGVNAVQNNFGELAHSPDLRVSKSAVGAPFTVTKTGSYRIVVRNAGELASSGSYTVSDRLPAGLTLAATPAGAAWSCVGAAGAGSFSCTSSSVIAAGASAAEAITAVVNVAAAAAAASPVDNLVMVEGGGEIDARKPSAAERDAFANAPAGLPLCTATISDNACRMPTPVQLAASISGTAWFDGGSTPRLLDGGDRRLPGWLVEVVASADGAIVGRATTGADGTWRVVDLTPGVTYTVRYREPQSGVVFGYPVNGESAPGSSGALCDAAAAASGRASSCVGSGATPMLSVVLAPGQDLPQQSLPVDPSGVVYDSGLRQPVPGSVVSLAPMGACAGWNPGSGIVGAAMGGYTTSGNAIAMTVGSDGFYQFLLAPSAPASCTFGLTVTPPAGYTFVSTAIPPATGPLVPSGGAGSVFSVQPQAGAPAGAVGPATTYYLTLTTGSAGANVVHTTFPSTRCCPPRSRWPRPATGRWPKSATACATPSPCRSPRARCRARPPWSTACPRASPTSAARRWSVTRRLPIRRAESGARWPSTSAPCRRATSSCCATACAWLSARRRATASTARVARPARRPQAASARTSRRCPAASPPTRLPTMCAWGVVCSASRPACWARSSSTATATTCRITRSSGFPACASSPARARRSSPTPKASTACAACRRAARCSRSTR
jgi:uncharacterized repeat protein (TIGR01451 family)